MKGKILGCDSSGGTISADDGKRYKFDASQWKGERPAAPGAEVDFDLDSEGKAQDVYAVTGASSINLDALQTKDGMTLGIVSLVLAVLGWFPVIGIVASIGGLITGVIGRKQAQAAANKTALLLCQIGIVLSVIALAITVIALMLGGGLVLAGLSALMH